MTDNPFPRPYTGTIPLSRPATIRGDFVFEWEDGQPIPGLLLQLRDYFIADKSFAAKWMEYESSQWRVQAVSQDINTSRMHRVTVTIEAILDEVSLP